MRRVTRTVGVTTLVLFMVAAVPLAILTGSLRWAEGSLIGRPAPELANQVWINSPPLRLQDLRGKVVLLEFWTFG